MKTLKILIGVCIVFACILFFRKGDRNTTYLFTIDTQSWFMIETRGRHFENEVLMINGIKPKYRLTVNSLEGESYVMPSKDEVKYGNPRNIQRIYLKLEPNQSVQEARIQLTYH